MLDFAHQGFRAGELPVLPARKGVVGHFIGHKAAWKMARRVRDASGEEDSSYHRKFLEPLEIIPMPSEHGMVPHQSDSAEENPPRVCL